MIIQSTITCPYCSCKKEERMPMRADISISSATWASGREGSECLQALQSVRKAAYM